MSIKLSGILPRYRLVRGFGHANEEVLLFDSQRYPVVTKGIQMVKAGNEYGIGENEICIIRLDTRTNTYEYDESAYHEVFNRPSRAGGTSKVSDVRVANKQLMTELRSHGQLSVALAGMEKSGTLDGNEAAIHDYLRATFEMIAKLPFTDRKLIGKYVRETFPTE
jgi:hypothetical protein